MESATSLSALSSSLFYDKSECPFTLRKLDTYYADNNEMRTEGYPRNPNNDGPRCIYCTVNPRRLRQSLSTIVIVFVMGILAISVSYYFQGDNSLTGLTGNLDPDLLKKFEFIDFQLSDLSKAVGNIQGLVNKFRSVGSPQSDKIMELVKNEISTYDSDKTGVTDFALENLGACIVSSKDTLSQIDESSVLTIFGIPIWSIRSNPRRILRPGMQPGECWAFQGRGEVIIKLMTNVYVTAISIEHISRSISPYGDISSAPKDFELFGISCLDENMPHKFGSFVYSDNGPTLQMFQVQNPSTRPFELVEVHFNTNHGNKAYTCVYRVRIHGKLAEQMEGG